MEQKWTELDDRVNELKREASVYSLGLSFDSTVVCWFVFHPAVIPGKQYFIISKVVTFNFNAGGKEGNEVTGGPI